MLLSTTSRSRCEPRSGLDRVAPSPMRLFSFHSEGSFGGAGSLVGSSAPGLPISTRCWQGRAGRGTWAGGSCHRFDVESRGQRRRAFRTCRQRRRVESVNEPSDWKDEHVANESVSGRQEARCRLEGTQPACGGASDPGWSVVARAMDRDVGDDAWSVVRHLIISPCSFFSRLAIFGQWPDRWSTDGSRIEPWRE